MTVFMLWRDFGLCGHSARKCIAGTGGGKIGTLKNGTLPVILSIMARG